MSGWRPLNSTFDGKRTDVLFDGSGKVIFRTQQEVQPILDYAKDLRNHDDRGYFAGGDMRRVASIPAVVIADWLKEGIDVFSGEHQAEVARKLNDPDNFYLRTAPGRLGPVGDGTYR
jgi:hypothetical protein